MNHIRGESIIPVGFALTKSAWRAGIATEMADAVLRYGFLDLKLPRVAGMTSLQNRASQHVLLKMGLERRGERAFAHPDYAAEGPMAWFERDREDWRAEHDRDMTCRFSFSKAPASVNITRLVRTDLPAVEDRDGTAFARLWQLSGRCCRLTKTPLLHVR